MKTVSSTTAKSTVEERVGAPRRELGGQGDRGNSGTSADQGMGENRTVYTPLHPTPQVPATRERAGQCGSHGVSLSFSEIQVITLLSVGKIFFWNKIGLQPNVTTKLGPFSLIFRVKNWCVLSPLFEACVFTLFIS